MLLKINVLVLLSELDNSFPELEAWFQQDENMDKKVIVQYTPYM